MPTTTLDMMEYANDALAQAAYISNGAYSADQIPDMTSNTAPSGVASTSGLYRLPWYAMNDSNAGADDWWASNLAGTPLPEWIKYQFTSAKIIQRYTMSARDYSTTHSPTEWTLQGSNNDSDWDTLDSQTGQSFTQAETKTYDFTNFTAYVYYRIYITASSSGTYVGLGQMELIERALECGSEAAIISQGTYALKAYADTSSINDTLVRTVSPTINLSGITRIKFDMRASRTGSNIKIGFHDSGGTTTEHTANIASVNTFQTETINMSPVSNANKDVIDSIIITIVNADATNTFYIDNIYAEAVSGVIFFGCNF